MKTKIFFKNLYLVIVLQLVRIAVKNMLLLLYNYNVNTNISLNALFMIFGTIIIIYKNKIHIDHKKSETLIISAIIYLLGIATLLINNDLNYSNIINLLYFLFILPIFEGILFREYIWNETKNYFNKFTGLINIILYTVWNLGFIDTLLINCSLTNQKFTITLFLTKILIGVIIGIITVTARKKEKDSVQSIIIHSLCNVLVK